MDKRETFLSALRASFGANDNNDAHKSPQQHQTSFNIAGHVFNIDKVELSIVLPDSKKKLTDRAFVLPYLLSILSTDTFKKNVEKFTFLLFNSLQKSLKDQSTLVAGQSKKICECLILRPQSITRMTIPFCI